ncbi:hypothetical protein L209DRAFT_746833 [Thermothelomyces heterothallicus CBS 203.75]
MPPRTCKNTRQKVFKSVERVTESDDASAPASPVHEAATPRPSARKAASKPAPKRKEPRISRYVAERRRKVIDIPSGNFRATRPFTIYKGTTTDSEKMVNKSLEELSEEAEVQKLAFWLKRAYVQIPILPAVVDNTRLDRLLRQGDLKYKYIASLKISTSLSTIRKDMIRSKYAKATTLNEWYAELLPLSIDGAYQLLELLGSRFPKAKYYSVSLEMTNAFYLALGSKRTADYLYNQESLIPAFAEIERHYNNVADSYKEVIKLLARASVTSDLIDTLPLEPIDWPRAIRLLGGNFDELKNM